MAVGTHQDPVWLTVSGAHHAVVNYAAPTCGPSCSGTKDKGDKKQARLPFETTRTTELTEGDMAQGSGSSHKQAAAPAQDNLVSLSSLEGTMDDVSSRMDTFAQKIDQHDHQLREAEQRISNVEDSAANNKNTLQEMEKVLKHIAAKNEDLEARSRRNKLRILWIPESANTGKMRYTLRNSWLRYLVQKCSPV